MNHVITLPGGLELVERTWPQESVKQDNGYQPLLEREVVIKRLLAHTAADPHVRGRFLKEARTLASLHHHSLIQVYDSGTHEGAPYVVMEKLEGVTVQQRLDLLLDQRTRMDLDEVRKIICDVTAALEYTHKIGVLIHDLSPGNITLTVDDRAVICGLAQPLLADISGASPTSVAYASPERLFGGMVDARSDVYALGVLLYHLLLGRLPFEGSSAGIVAQKQSASSLPLLDDPRAELPCSYALAHVMRQATARHAGQRYTSASAFREAFIYALEGQPAKLQTQLRLRPRPSQSVLQRLQTRRPKQAPGASVGLFKHAPAPAAVDDEIEEELLLLRGTMGNAGVQLAELRDLPASAVPAAATTEYIDPLMPGRDEPALQAALPYTILVPLPAPAEDAAATPQQASATLDQQPAATSLIWVVGMILLSLLAINIATRLG